ncbi:MAG TPA: protoporphyrinogen oxidase HemJ [Prochlorococcaceae cyanobacterium AMR_MDS_5431]|nr:protoporphyrinogen oxidase HemJ [Prochlorococcaceae cyanobacterium AMR_MDS_5431]
MAIGPELYLWFKTLHIVGVVVWFAGLFYLVRLFIYHAETANMDPILRKMFHNQYALMEERLMNIITTPGMLVTILMATGLLLIEPVWLTQPWMQAKISLVLFLLFYHLFCYRIMGQLKTGNCYWSGKQLRALNELPTLLLLVIVMLVVFKSSFPTGVATWLVILLIILMALSIQLYARSRRIKEEKELLTK